MVTSENNKLCRHSSVSSKTKTIKLNHWLNDRKCRSVSVPDLNKLKKEWDEYQQSDTSHPIPDTQMQVKSFFLIK